VPAPNGKALSWLILGAACVIATIGWKLFWFLTDDSYIAFRYVSNSVLGRGLVWNPAPFQPVEGYTSFLWVVVLREIWVLTGLQPPQCANIILLFFGLCSLYLGMRLVLRLTLPPAMEPWRPVFLALALLGTVTNPTYLAWLSSGLEASLFNFLFIWWVYEGTAPSGRGTPAWCVRLTLSAALTALCRPDGLLMVVGTAAMLLVELRPVRWRALLASSPLLLIPAHVLWRRATYGDWLPNTYRAKYEGPWPQSGIRYLASFILEFGVWWWLVLAAAWAVKRVRAPGGLGAFSWQRLSAAVPVAVLVGHLGYYTFMIGGDHFEYRVYSHLIVLLFVTAVLFATRLARSGAGAAALVAGFILASWPIPWVHWSATKDIEDWHQGNPIVVAIADRFPWPLRPVVAVWDDLQDWLVRGHMVCMRHQEHKIFLERQLRVYPPREVGEKLTWDGRNVRSDAAVGYPGWILPNVAIIDRLGLADRVIARYGRTRSKSVDKRVMAHDRKPPPGYMECFKPDVFVDKAHVWLDPRKTPLTDDDIRRCEAIDWNNPQSAYQDSRER
jgi:arabinofuranosyltransferase